MENLKQRLTGIRNNLYDNMPTGKIDAFELTSVINAHLTELDSFIDNECDGYTLPDTESKLNMPVVNGSISAGDAIMAILDWMKSDDCWIEDKNGNKLTDVEICGKFNPKYLEKYYR